MYGLDQAERILQGITIDVPAGQKLYGVMPGDTVRVKATIQYRGPAYSDTFYAAIGNWVVVFDEYWVGSIPVSFAQSTDWVTYELTVDILITKVANFPWTPGWFDIYAKLTKPGIGGLLTPRLDNVIEVILAAEFQNFNITSYDKIPGA
jgi:hypothetical protein